MRLPRTSLGEPGAHLTVPGDPDRSAGGADVEITLFGAGQLILKQGLQRIDLPPASSRTLLRWMFWHALHGLWGSRSPRT